MPNYNGLRDHIRNLMDHGPAGVPLEPATVYRRIQEDGKHMPVSRALFCSWFRRTRPADASPRIVDCVDALAPVFKVDPWELLRKAEVVPTHLDQALILAEASKTIATQVRAANRALRELQTLNAGESIVVDRILRAHLDYEIRVWPVIRGSNHSMHLRSWISLKPIRRDHERRRGRTQEFETMSDRDRRRAIRYKVINDRLWRSLGLRWRDTQPTEWAHEEATPLLIEVPIDEKNQDPKGSARNLDDRGPSRLLLLSGLWSHAEPLGAILADAYDWGNFDLRFQGYGEDERAERLNLAKTQLRSTTTHYIWALAEDAKFLTDVAKHVVAAAAHHQVVFITYDGIVTRAAAQAWARSQEQINASSKAAFSIAQDINRKHPVIHVDYIGEDFSHGGTVDVDLFIDHVLYSAAEIAKLLRVHRSGPGVSGLTGRYFEELRVGAAGIEVPERKTSVTWLAANELKHRRRARGAQPRPHEASTEGRGTP